MIKTCSSAFLHAETIFWGSGPEKSDDAAQYALSVVAADLAERGDDDVLQKVSADFKAGAVHLSDAEIRQKMDALLAEAKSQIASGK